jgi:nucleoid-associated protein YgaU
MDRCAPVGRSAVLAPAVVASAVLVAVSPRPPLSPAAAAAWVGSATADEAVMRLAALSAWAVTAWLAGCLLLVCLARVPGWTGRAAGACARRVTPALVRRSLETAVGLTVAALPVAAPGAAMADDGPPRPAGPTAAAAWTPPSLDRPGDVSPSPVHTYVVRPGDCLWTIARNHLGGRRQPALVAQAWPQWYAANKHVIGADPDLLHPGQRLTVPTDAVSR